MTILYFAQFIPLRQKSKRFLAIINYCFNIYFNIYYIACWNFRWFNNRIYNRIIWIIESCNSNEAKWYIYRLFNNDAFISRDVSRAKFLKFRLYILEQKTNYWLDPYNNRFQSCRYHSWLLTKCYGYGTDRWSNSITTGSNVP